MRILAFLGYVSVAVVFTWPLSGHLATHVLGPLSGDTGVYIWNLWSFAHELGEGRSPLFTSTVFAMSPSVDLSLHNYTLAFGVPAWPLLQWLPPATVYNLLVLAALVVNGLAGYALVYRVTSHRLASWLGGLVFGFSPFVIARTTGHLSLVAAAPLAVFWLNLDTWRRTGRIRAAVLTGISLAWAFFCDPYYAVYCVVLGAAFVAPLAVTRETRVNRRWSRVALGLEVGLAVSLTLAVVIAATGGWTLSSGGLTLRMHTSYTPMLAATAFGLARWAGRFRWKAGVDLSRWGRISGPGVAAGAGAALVAMAPWLYALAHRLRDGEPLSEPIVWRNSVPGLDVMGLLAPNPSHWAMTPFSEWFAARPGGFIENVGSIPMVVLVVIGVAVWRYRVRFPAWWVGVSLAFGLLSLGPFIYVAGFNTHVPGPWALLRYVPLLASARNPSRFAIVVAMGVAVLFGVALVRVLRDSGRHQRLVFATVTVALLVELAPMPRTLYSAHIPKLYQIIAADPRPVRVLDLPFGLRDGTRTLGGYNTARLYYQTFHGKASLGGYISRLGRAEIRRQRESRVLRALLYLSEGGAPLSLPDTVLRARGARFVRRANLGYVVVNRQTAPEALVRYAIASFGLEWVAEDEGRALYRVTPYAGVEGAQNLARNTAHARGVTIREPY